MRITRAAALSSLAALIVACGGLSRRLDPGDTSDASASPQPPADCAPANFAHLFGPSGAVQVQSDGSGHSILWGTGSTLDPPSDSSFIAKLDPTGALDSTIVIDPIQATSVNGVAINTEGTIAVGGSVFDLTASGDRSHMVLSDRHLVAAQFDSAQHLLWIKPIQCTAPCYRGGVAIDDSGELAVEGLFAGSIDFGTTSTGDRVTLTSDQGTCLETFVAKLSADGDPVWAQQFPHAACLDSSNPSFVIPGPSGPLTFAPDGSILVAAWGHGGNDEAGPQIDDPFLLKIDPDGGLIWKVRCPGFAVDDLAVSASGQISISARASQFDLTLGAIVLRARGTSDWILATFAPDGSVLRARRFGAPDTFVTARATLDDLGNTWALLGVDRLQASRSLDLGGISLKSNATSDLVLVGLDPAWHVRTVTDYPVTPLTPGGHTESYSRGGIAVDRCYNGAWAAQIMGGSVDVGGDGALSAEQEQWVVGGSALTY
jgi:hypothetical protein